MTIQHLIDELNRKATHATDLIGVPVGFEFIVNGRAYRFSRCNDQGIPYLRRVLRNGKFSQKEYTIEDGTGGRQLLQDAYRMATTKMD